MTLPKFIQNPIVKWAAPYIGSALIALASAGLIAIASTKFVTREALAKDVSTPLAATQQATIDHDKSINDLVAAKDALEKRSAAAAQADEKRDASIRALLETTQALAVEVKANAEKTRGHEAQIIALQSTTAGIRTEIAVVQANQIAAAKQSDRIEDKLDRLIEGRSRP